MLLIKVYKTFLRRRDKKGNSKIKQYKFKQKTVTTKPISLLFYYELT